MTRAQKWMSVFERDLSVWVGACMLLGVAVGKLFPGFVGALRDLEFGENSHINVAIAVLIWLMIYPMMLSPSATIITNLGWLTAHGLRLTALLLACQDFSQVANRRLSGHRGSAEAVTAIVTTPTSAYERW